MPEQGKKTIDEVLDEFLAEQEDRWSRATFEKYETVVGLLKRYMQSYFPGHDGESEAVRKAGGTYCGTYGPKDIGGALSMFLGYFMPNKARRLQANRRCRPSSWSLSHP
jgi:hypothetical protein